MYNPLFIETPCSLCKHRLVTDCNISRNGHGVALSTDLRPVDMECENFLPFPKMIDVEKEKRKKYVK